MNEADLWDKIPKEIKEYFVWDTLEKNLDTVGALYCIETRVYHRKCYGNLSYSAPERKFRCLKCRQWVKTFLDSSNTLVKPLKKPIRTSVSWSLFKS